MEKGLDSECILKEESSSLVVQWRIFSLNHQRHRAVGLWQERPQDEPVCKRKSSLIGVISSGGCPFMWRE